MEVELVLFAGLRERFGRDRWCLRVPVGITAAELFTYMTDDVEDAAALASCTRCAIHDRYVPASTVLQPGDEVVMIPPVAGG